MSNQRPASCLLFVNKPFFFLSLALLLAPLSLFSQKKGLIEGVVRDERGEPLPFASVFVRNSSNGTAANANGAYKLPVNYGRHEIVFQYIGYRQRIDTVEVGPKNLTLNVRMVPNDLEISEVVVTGEDPAVKIMREVIAKRAYYHKQISQYSSDVYVKGLYRIAESPKKILGQEVGNMGGMLDSSGAGIVYLSESVSKMYIDGGQAKEIMVSSKVSGSNDGYSMNRATFTDFDLYREHIEIEREILSPLADNAFQYYTFKYRGEFLNLMGFKIEKIELIPKRSSDPAFHGFLYIVDNQWNLAGADIWLSGAAIKQPVLDTLKIKQEFIPVQLPDTWRLLTQTTSFKFGLLGFKINGFYNTVFSNYNLKPDFSADFFGRESFRIEEDANKKDALYWTEARPIPLTKEEGFDYSKKDSLKAIWESKAFMDSTDRRANRFNPFDLLTGYHWRNSYRRIDLDFPGARKWIQFNTVQGWLVNFEPTYSKSTKRNIQSFDIKGIVNYGFSEKRLRGALEIDRKFESIYYSRLQLSGGIIAEQFNGRRPIGVLVNGLYSLFDARNYMKLYDKTYLQAAFSRYLHPTLGMKVQAEWSERSPLRNTSLFTYSKGQNDYTPNAPILNPETPNADFFQKHQAFILGLDFTLRIKQTYSSYPKQRSYEGTEWPVFTLRYRKAIAGIAGSDIGYDHLQLEMRKYGLSWGLAGQTDFIFSAGAFFNRQRMEFIDWYHPIGNQTFISPGEHYLRGFNLLPYYAYSIGRAGYAEAHIVHNFQGWILDKIPGLRKLNWKERFGLHAFYSDQPAADPAFTGKLPYWEASFGFTNIGFKFFRPFRVEFVGGFYGDQFYKSGVMIGVDLN